MYLTFQREMVQNNQTVVQSLSNIISGNTDIWKTRFESSVFHKREPVGKIAYEKGIGGQLFRIATVQNSFPFGINLSLKFNKGQKYGNLNLVPMGNFGVRDEQGTIYYCTEDLKLMEYPKLKRIQYLKFVFPKREYNAYDVCIFHEGTYFCIYDNNDLICVVSRRDNILTCRAEYDIYAEDDLGMELPVFFAAYYDMTHCMNVHADEDGRFPVYQHTTLQHEYIQKKFSPGFIKRIKELDDLYHGYSYKNDIEKN